MVKQIYTAFVMYQLYDVRNECTVITVSIFWMLSSIKLYCTVMLSLRTSWGSESSERLSLATKQITPNPDLLTFITLSSCNRHTTRCKIRCKYSMLHCLKYNNFWQRVSIACYAERCLSYDRFCLTDRPTVRPSHAGIMPKRLQLQSCGLHWRIAPWF